MSTANALEEQMLKLVNGERANAGLNPLRFSDTLNTSSEDHSSWMLDVDKFDHQGISGSTPHDRMVKAGYQFEGNWHSGENIAYMSEDSTPGLASEVAELHAGLMNSPGHRANILNPDFTEIGIGIEKGKFGDGSGEFDAVMISQNFAHTDADPNVTEDPPVKPEDEGTDVVTEDPPVKPEDEGTDVVTEDPPVKPEDEGTDVVTEDPPVKPEDEGTDVVTEDPPVKPEDEGTDVVTEDPPVKPEDEGTDVVTEDPPVKPEDEGTGEGDSFLTDLREMFGGLFDGEGGVDCFVFIDSGPATGLADQSALNLADAPFFMPGEFGSLQKMDAPQNTDMAQISDLDAGGQSPDTTGVESDWGGCGGFESFFG